MRLICEFDDGSTANIRAAIDRSPYDVRGLVFEAFFYCQHVLPDSMGFLQAEHSIRHTLNTFEADQDRYVKSYILSRTLDSRTQKTQRADLIHASFQWGGPIVLAGLFYATFNASRNARNLETLEFLLKEASEPTRKDLYRRAKAFPCHPSTCSWFGRIIDRVSPDSQSLAYLFSCLGASEVPQALFTRVRQPSRTWDKDGEVIEVIPPSRMYLDQDVSYRVALRDLEKIGFARATTTLVRVDQNLARLLKDVNLDPWRIQAVEMVCHAFPKHEWIDPDIYAEQCELMLPCLHHVLSFFVDSQVVLYFTQMPQLALVVEACLSSAAFGDRSSKELTLSAAEKLLESLKHAYVPDHELLRARIELKKAIVRRSYTYSPFQDSFNTTHTRVHSRSMVLEAELLILEAEKEIDSHHFDSALHKLSLFSAAISGEPLTLQRIMKDRVATIRGSIYRFSGRFSEAHQVLESLNPDKDVILQLSAVLCELGDCDRAVMKLQGQLQVAYDFCSQEQIRLALAHAHFFKCLQTTLEGQQSPESLKAATETYRNLRQHIRPVTRKDNLDIFSISAGLAILDRIQGNLAESWSEWKDAFNALKLCGLSAGYLDALVLYSMDEIESKDRETGGGFTARDNIRLLFEGHDREHRFLGLGSLWPDVLGKLISSHDGGYGS